MSESKAPAALPGHVGNLTEQQTAALASMQGMFPPSAEEGSDADHPFPMDEYTLLRFLRARDFKVPDAAQMLKNTLAWRKKMRVDDILTNPPAYLKAKQELYGKVTTSRYFGVDQFGRPAFVQQTGLMHTDVLIRNCTLEDVMLVHIWDMEEGQRRCRESSKKLGYKVETLLNLLDLTGLSLGHRSLIPYLSAISKLDEQNYPETLGTTVIFNAPSAFSVIFPLVKPLLDVSVQNKIRVLGHGEEKKIVDEFFAHDSAQIPAFVGGTLEWTPTNGTEEELFAYCKAQEDALGMTALEVGAGKIEKVTLQVPAADVAQTIHWYFRTAAHNINFGVTFTETGKAVQEVREVKAAEAQYLPFVGSHNLAVGVAGEVEFTFDNYASYFNAKHVTYNVRVLPTTSDDTYYE